MIKDKASDAHKTRPNGQRADIRYDLRFEKIRAAACFNQKM